MLHVKQVSKRRRRGKAVPILGAAGLSLSLASGASAATAGPTAEMLTRNIGVSHEITLREEEIADVSLATFAVFDKETPGATRSGRRFAMGAGGGGCGCGCACGCGLGGCGGCWAGGTYNAAPGIDADQPREPAHKHGHAHKRTHVSKNS
jgi:hypothetical protein